MGHLIWLFITYYKYNIKTKRYYFGKTSGLVENIDAESIVKIVKKRDKYHHRNGDGFGDAVVDKYSTESDAIRGREQIMIEHTKSTDENGNIYNGISPRNPKRAKYIAAAIRVFGDMAFSGWMYSLVF